MHIFATPCPIYVSYSNSYIYARIDIQEATLPLISKGLQAFNCQLLEYAFPSAPPSTTAHAPSSLAPTGQVTGVETSHAVMTKSMGQPQPYHTSLPQLYIGMQRPFGHRPTNLTLNSFGTKRAAEARDLPPAQQARLIVADC